MSWEEGKLGFCLLAKVAFGIIIADMMSTQLFNFRKHSWPPDEYVSRATLQLLDFDGGAPPEQAWRRRLNSHANILKEFSVTFMEAIKMMHLGIRLWSYVRKEASQGRKAPIDPFTRERCKPSASLGVPLGGMGYVQFWIKGDKSTMLTRLHFKS